MVKGRGSWWWWGTVKTAGLVAYSYCLWHTVSTHILSYIVVSHWYGCRLEHIEPKVTHHTNSISTQFSWRLVYLNIAIGFSWLVNKVV